LERAMGRVHHQLSLLQRASAIRSDGADSCCCRAERRSGASNKNVRLSKQEAMDH
jgi:hypothetical protein